VSYGLILSIAERHFITSTGIQERGLELHKSLWNFYLFLFFFEMHGPGSLFMAADFCGTWH
jgi:hypothetical protein